MKFKKIICVILIVICPFTFLSCKKQNKDKENKELNMYIDIKDKHSLNILKILIEDYKKHNDNIKINVNSSLGDNIQQELSKDKSPDLIFTSRNKMIELSQKGLLDNMETYYEKLNISKDYYNVFSSYSRFGDKYYGIPIVPYTVEFLYNEKALEKLKIKNPENINDIKIMIKNLKDSSIKIPVMITEDMDVNTMMFSIISNNIINSMDLEKVYNKGKKNYLDLKNMQEPFQIINELVKENILDKNTFEEGNEVTIDKFNNGDMPFLIATSYYNSEIKNPDIKSVKQLYNVDKLNNIEPVLVNCILSIPLKAKNSEQANKFIESIFKEKNQRKILESGFITGNKKVNKEKESSLSQINKNTLEKLNNLNENSILIVYNLPESFKSGISSSMDKILNKEYTGREWYKIVEDSVK